MNTISLTVNDQSLSELKKEARITHYYGIHRHLVADPAFAVLGKANYYDQLLYFHVCESFDTFGFRLLQDRKDISRFKQVFRKAASCVGCRVCETNCKNGCISFKNGLESA